MQNNFEKQVQLKMEEFKLIPSDPVWQKVEKQIRKKREKRRFLFFLLFVGLLIGAGIWWGLAGNSNEHIAVKQHSALVNNNVKDPQNKTVPNKIEEKPISATGVTSLTQKHSRSVELKTNSTAFNNTSKISNQKQSFLLTSSNGLRIKKQQAEKKEPITVQQKPGLQIVSTISISPVKITTKNEPEKMVYKADTSIINKETEKQGKTSSIDSAVKKKIAGTKRKWERAIVFQAGWSSYQSGLFNMSKAADAFSNPVNYSPGSQIIYNSKKVTRGLSFAIGAEFKKSFGKRSSIAIGIQYHFYSTHIAVGQKKLQDTTVNYNSRAVSLTNYYTSNGQNDYINKYGVIEIPVSFDRRLFKTIPLHLAVGASFGHLLKTNALTFDHTANIYYYNKDNVVRNYVSVFTLLQYEFAKNSRMKIKAGPIIQYTISKLQKENRYSIPHLFFAGIKTSINF